MPATINLQSTAAFLTPFGTLPLGPLSVTGTIIPVPLAQVLAAGNNSFAVPTGAVGVIITPPPSNAIALKSKAQTGINGTVTLTVGSTIVTGVAVGVAGTLFPASSTFLGTPTQAGGSGC